MAKESNASEPANPEINPDHIDLDVDTNEADSPLDPNQTIEEAEASATTPQSGDADDIYKQASDETVISDSSAPVNKPKKSKKKLLVTLLVLLLLAGAGAAAWYFLLRDKPDQAPAPAAEAPQTEPAELSYIPETIAYAFRDGENNPFTLFWRPAAGGDRTQVEILNRAAQPAYSDAHGANVVFVADEKLYASTDYGKSYKQVFESEAGAQITSVKLSADGSKLAIGYLPDGAEKNTVRSMALDGQDAKDLFQANDNGVTILGWNDERFVYSEHCYGCGGALPKTYSRDLKDNKATALLEGVNLGEIGAMAVSGDVTKFIYVVGTNDGNAAQGIERGIVAPYKVNLVDIATNKSETKATVGTKGEKNPNGTVKYRDLKVGFLAGDAIAYYVDDTTLYTLSGDEPNTFYKSESPIWEVPFISEKTVIAAAGPSFSEYTLVNFDVEGNKGTTIFEGDANTVILGVTTK